MMEKQTKIGTVCSDFDTFQLKSMLVKNDAGDWGSEPDKDAIGVIRSTNFNNDGKLDLSDIAYRTLSKRKFEEKKLHASDILIERSGGSETQPVGRIGYITDEMAKTDYAFANFIQRISLNDEVNAKFVYYCLQQMYEMGITAGMQSQTTGIRNLDWKQYIKVALPQPSSDEQSVIAAILSKVDQAIAAVQGSISAAERLKKSLMQNLLTGRMKSDGTLRKEDDFYVDEKFGRVPVGWEVRRLKDICLNSGDYGANASAIDYDETKPRFIRITDIDDFGQLLDEGKASMAGDNTTKYMLEEDDFLFARTGDTVGKSLLYKKEMGPAVYAGYLIKFTFDRNLVLPDYFDLIAKSEFFEAFKIAMKRVGAKPNINSREYCSFKFLLPSDIKEQKEIFGRFAHIDKTQKEKQNKIAVLERLKKSLMQNLLTGRVRVK